MLDFISSDVLDRHIGSFLDSYVDVSTLRQVCSKLRYACKRIICVCSYEKLIRTNLERIRKRFPFVQSIKGNILVDYTPELSIFLQQTEFPCRFFMLSAPILFAHKWKCPSLLDIRTFEKDPMFPDCYLETHSLFMQFAITFTKEQEENEDDSWVKKDDGTIWFSTRWVHQSYNHIHLLKGVSSTLSVAKLRIFSDKLEEVQLENEKTLEIVEQETEENTIKQYTIDTIPVDLLILEQIPNGFDKEVHICSQVGAIHIQLLYCENLDPKSIYPYNCNDRATTRLINHTTNCIILTTNCNEHFLYFPRLRVYSSKVRKSFYDKSLKCFWHSPLPFYV